MSCWTTFYKFAQGMGQEKYGSIFLYKEYFTQFFIKQGQKVKRQNNLDIPIN